MSTMRGGRVVVTMETMIDESINSTNVLTMMRCQRTILSIAWVMNGMSGRLRTQAILSLFGAIK